jgi:hypothetical protein
MPKKDSAPCLLSYIPISEFLKSQVKPVTVRVAKRVQKWADLKCHNIESQFRENFTADLEIARTWILFI